MAGNDITLFDPAGQEHQVGFGVIGGAAQVVGQLDEH
jgi:hypothetical protein